MASLPPHSLRQVARFCRQFQQLESNLTYPDPLLLRQSDVQSEIFQRLFAVDGHAPSPPRRYQLRVLKELVTRLEGSIKDWNADGISEDIVGKLSQLLCSPLPPEYMLVQQKSYVTYHLSELKRVTWAGLPDNDMSSPTITILESRSIISASGTTGMRTWEASLHLGQFLCKNPHLIEGRNVLELGAGTGYLSIMCAKYLGAAQVIASDGSDDVIGNLPDNLFLNGLQGNSIIRVMDLKWGHALVGAEEEYWNRGQQIDVALGADITYDGATLAALVSTLGDLLDQNPKMLILISATERNIDTLDAFDTICRRAGIVLENIAFATPKMEDQDGPFYSDAVSIRLYNASRIPPAT